jgi:hypothetical protein
MNEPTLAGMGGAPVGYDARTYGRDLAVFHSFTEEDGSRHDYSGAGFGWRRREGYSRSIERTVVENYESAIAAK